jgi:nitrite reductase/ring-hydroxylating ferredoxin subunit
MTVKILERGIFQRLFGLPATPTPAMPGCWRYLEGNLVIDLGAAAELQKPGGALRFEGGNLPRRVLVVHGEDGRFRAFDNRCTHFGHRRRDPVPGTQTVQCCSLNKSTYNITTGEKTHGPTPKPVVIYPVVSDGVQLVVRLIGLSSNLCNGLDI